MNILVVGAGAIGTLFGVRLSQHNTVCFFVKPSQTALLQNQGFILTGNTKKHMHLPVAHSVRSIPFIPDVILLAVKAYDTDIVMQSLKPVLSKKTVILSLQNGLDNYDTIQRYVASSQIIGGITTHGAYLVSPGVVRHTGIGTTILGEIRRTKTKRVVHLASVLRKAGIQTHTTTHVQKALWEKAIINSSINPLTALFSCKNGYLLRNPVLETLVKQICVESTQVARSSKIPVTSSVMIRKTVMVIQETAQNYSSMAQSIQKKKKTEIDSINGIIVRLGKRKGENVSINELLVRVIHMLSQ